MKTIFAHKIGYLIFFLFLVIQSQAQQKHFSSEILSAVFSQDGERMACTTTDSVYVLKMADLSVQHTWAHSLGYLVVKGFHVSNPDILITQVKNTRPSFQQGRTVLELKMRNDAVWEQPRDSTLIWSLAKRQVIHSLPGTFYMQYGKGTDQFAGIVNGTYAFAGMDGDTLHASRGAQVMTKQGAFEKISNADKACRELQLSADLKYFAASWYQYVKNGPEHSFSIHDFNSHEVLYSIDSLYQLPAAFCFSPSGSMLAVSGVWQKGGLPSIKIIDARSGKVMHEIKGLGSSLFDKIQNLQFDPSSQKLYFKSEDDWQGYDLGLGRITTRVGRSLGEMFDLHDALAVNNKVVFIGVPVGDAGTKGEGGFVNTVSLPDLSILADVQTATIATYADSNKYSLLVNSVTKSNATPLIRFNTSRSVFTSVTGNQLSVWHSDQKKKLLELPFKQKIQAFPSMDGKKILVLEDKGEQYYGEYTMHVVHPTTSTIKSSAVIKIKPENMKGIDQCQCIGTGKNSWYCIDGTKLWEVQPDFSMKMIGEKEGEEFVKLDRYGNDYYLMSKAKDGYKVYKWSGNIFTEEAMLADQQNMNVVAGNVWLWKKDATTIEVWKNNVKQPGISANGEIERVDAAGDQAVVQYKEKGYSTVAIYDGKNLGAGEKTDIIGGRFYIRSAQELILEKDGFSSWFNNASFQYSWTVQTPQVLSSTNFDVSPNGNYILFDKLLINLTDIESRSLDKFDRAMLLQDTGSLSALLLHEDPYGAKPGFTLQRVNLHKKDTVRSKLWINMPQGVSSIGYGHDKIIASPDKSWALTYTLPGMFASDKPAPPVLWNVKTMSGNVLPQDAKYISAGFVGNKEVQVSTAEKVYRFQLQPFKLLYTTSLAEGWKKSNVKDRFIINSKNVEWYKKEKDSVALAKSFFSKEYLNDVIYDSTSKKIFAGSSSGNIICWQVTGSSSPLAILPVHSAPVSQMLMRDGLLYSLAENGEIGVIDMKTAQLKVLMKVLVKDNEPKVAMITPAGYYRIDQGLINDLHFIKNGEVFPVSSFDLSGNRPDKVYEALGKAPPDLIRILQKSWESRISKLGLSSLQHSTTAGRPLVTTSFESLPQVTSLPSIPLSFQIKDKEHLKAVHLRVNGVPVYGREGYVLKKGEKEARIETNLRLHAGKNDLSLVAINQKGEESIEQTAVVYRNMPAQKQRIVYIGVGVSKYADTTMNLRYAAKDVADIAGALKGYADTVISYTLTDKEATLQNIKALKTFLKETLPDDVVILSFSGHGMVKKDKGFYFAAHDMNFKNPEEGGVPMETIEDLLDSIPAYKKLLLLDACHSGEESSLAGKTKLPEGVSATITRGSVEEDAGGSGAKDNSYLLMKELFNDFSRGNGTFIISAAASNEFAFEGDNWKNGVFTMSFLQALRELRYTNSYNSQPVKVKELRKLIYEKVNGYTNGLQNPTSRQENGWWNWSF